MESPVVHPYQEQLVGRRQQLTSIAARQGGTVEIRQLIDEIDAALQRIEAGTYGFCETCADPIEPDRLLADPLTRFCLDHLTPHAQRALQQDLDMAVRIQRELLPRPERRFDGWDFAYHYQPAGPVSGDYCDLIPGSAGELYFLLGDVAGHGVAAAMLMSHLSALLRTLISIGLPLQQLMERTSRVFCESTLPMHYATLVCGRAEPSGEIEVCNAGHPPPLVLGRSGVERIEATGLPIGMFCTEQFASRRLRLQPGEMLLLYTDGVVEARNPGGDEYGLDRMMALVSSVDGAAPAPLVESCVRNIIAFGGSSSFADDVSVLALRRE
jgi:sigma-B regulation protein RsbU (phosphoserine phosphatase)